MRAAFRAAYCDSKLPAHSAAHSAADQRNSGQIRLLTSPLTACADFAATFESHYFV